MSIYEEVEIEDMAFDTVTQIYSYACPCGDKFVIALEELLNGEDIANCPSCTLRIRVIFDEDSLPELREDAEEINDESETKDSTGNDEADALSLNIEAISISNAVVDVEA